MNNLSPKTRTIFRRIKRHLEEKPSKPIRLKNLSQRKWRNPNPYLSNISVSNSASKRIRRHINHEIRQSIQSRKKQSKHKRKYNQMLNRSPPYIPPIELKEKIGTKF